MTQCPFDGEYWNVVEETSSITRLLFTHLDDVHFVEAWGSCFPRDCEWGETELYLLNDKDEAGIGLHAFATWDWDPDPTHCLFELSANELVVTKISLQSEIKSYKVSETFRKDESKSVAARNADPLDKFKAMWDGSEPGWRLIQYDKPVYLIEFNFDESGPTRGELPAVIEFEGLKPGETEEQKWELLRGCEGIGLGAPIGSSRMERLRQLESEYDLDLTVQKIEPDDYLVLQPSGGHYGMWTVLPSYRRPIVERMLDAGVPVVSGRLN